MAATSPGPVYTVVRGGRILDVSGRRAAPGDLLIAGDRIEAVGPPGLPAPSGARTIDAADCLLMPGLVNAHTHGHGALTKGAGDRWTLELLLNAGPWMNAAPSLERKYLSALQNGLEMLAKGCTACYDLYFEFPSPSREGLEAAARGYRDAGVRAVLAPMVADHTFYQAIPGLLDALPEPLRAAAEKSRLAPGETTLSACREILHEWSVDRDRVRPALAPTVPLHCSDEFIVQCRDLAREYEVGLHMHLAESKIQAVAGIRKYGRTLTAHLDALGFLGPHFTGAHCVWLDPDDIRRIADRGASIAHNPGSNLRLGSGLAAAREMREAGVNVGIGTDGSNCSDNQNMFGAMRIASFASRVRAHDPARWLGTDEVLGMATAGSAAVLGFGDALGRLAPGALADIVFIDLGHVNYWPLNDPVNQLVHVEEGCAVQRVMVGGEIRYGPDGFRGIDVADVRRRIDESVEALRDTGAELRRGAEALESAITRFCVGLSREPYHVHAMASAGESG